MTLPKLDPAPARTDLTDRECAKLLGAAIGGLLQMASVEDVRAAVRWWSKLERGGWDILAAQVNQSPHTKPEGT